MEVHDETQKAIVFRMIDTGEAHLENLQDLRVELCGQVFSSRLVGVNGIQESLVMHWFCIFDANVNLLNEGKLQGSDQRVWYVL